MNWYIEMDLCLGTKDQNEMAQIFKDTFNFEVEELALIEALKVLQQKILL